MPKSPIARAVLILCFGLTLLLMGLAGRWYLQSGDARVGETVASGRALIGGPFDLVDPEGRQITDKSLAGDYLLVYFGYTYCPDICPTELATMTQALLELESKSPEVAARIRPVFITVDPERDDRATMAAYAEFFHPRLVALTGNPTAVAEAAKSYRVYYKKVESESATEYLVDHSSFIYLMSPEGEYVTHYRQGMDASELAKSLHERVTG